MVSNSKRTISREDRLQAISLAKKGMDRDEIGEAMGMGGAFPREYIAMNSLDQQLDMIADANAGMTPSEVGEKYGMQQRRAWQLVGSPEEEARDPNMRSVKLKLTHHTVEHLVARGNQQRVFGDDETVMSEFLNRTYASKPSPVTQRK